MLKSAPVLFKCPHCDALYSLVKAEAGPETKLNHEMTCAVCAEALPAREGKFILKYFLLRKAARRGRYTRRDESPLVAFRPRSLTIDMLTCRLAVTLRAIRIRSNRRRFRGWGGLGWWFMMHGTLRPRWSPNDTGAFFMPHRRARIASAWRLCAFVARSLAQFAS